jgi:signal transduction histidine kinase
MASGPKPDRTPSGEVIYRRVAPPPSGKRESRLDPALLPLVGGFALLILLILLLGNLSVLKLEDTSRRALDLENSYSERTKLLLQLRVTVTQLDNEARSRMEANARREIRPPFDLRLDTSRNRVNDLLPKIDHMPADQFPKWIRLRDELATYVEVTRDADRYSKEGFTRFRDVDTLLNQIIADSAGDQLKIVNQANEMQQSATRTIRIWNLFALIAGLLVATATLWQVQRRFSQTRQSTEEARREREFSNQMLEGMVSAIAAIDRQDRIRSANSAFMRIFPDANIGSSIHDPIASPEGVKLLEAATASHVEAATYRGRWNLTENGVPATFDVYSSPLEIDGQHGQILTLVDVTEAAKSEAALRRTEALAAVGEAAAQLAHEIKNPLGSIRLGVEMLREYTSAGEALNTISLVERGISHLNKLVVDVTQFSRHRQLEKSETELHELIDSSVELVADRVRDKQTIVIRDFEEKPIRGIWDNDQLREVFVNLLGNAIDASAKGSPVKITTDVVESHRARVVGSNNGPAGRQVRISITDFGSGMDAKVQSRLFEPFFTTKKRGTGLGLSIVRQIIDLHGGSIEVESQVGKGTTFRVELPLEGGPHLSAEPAA